MNKKTEMDEIREAAQMLGAGYDHPSIEIEPARLVIERRNGRMEEVERAAFIKISTAFKAELKDIDEVALKVWIFIALSVNRYTNKANPGLRAIHEGTGFAINTIQEALKRLENDYGLLLIEKGSGKSANEYLPLAFVSANRSVSATDTQESGSVSVRDASVSVSKSSVSASRQKNAQPENQRNQTNSINGDGQKNFEFKGITDFMLVANPTTEELVALLEKENQTETAISAFEVSLGFKSLPWDTSTAWELLARFVTKQYQMNTDVFREFEEWRKIGRGKYSGWTNKQIRTNPKVFIDSAFPEFEASKMYEEKGKSDDGNNTGKYQTSEPEPLTPEQEEQARRIIERQNQRAREAGYEV